MTHNKYDNDILKQLTRIANAILDLQDKINRINMMTKQ